MILLATSAKVRVEPVVEDRSSHAATCVLSWASKPPLTFQLKSRTASLDCPSNSRYGVSAPEMGYDDFANLDCRGKVLVEFRGAPPRFPHNERAYYSNPIVKEQAAVAHGAIGLLQMLVPADEARVPWDRVVRQSRLPSRRCSARRPAHRRLS